MKAISEYVEEVDLQHTAMLSTLVENLTTDQQSRSLTRWLAIFKDKIEAMNHEGTLVRGRKVDDFVPNREEIKHWYEQVEKPHQSETMMSRALRLK